MPDQTTRLLRGTFRIPVGDGHVLAGPHPVTAPEGLEDRVKALIEEAGVTHFVDLSSSHDWMPGYRDHLPPNCAYTRYEIIDRRLPEDSDALKALLHRVIDEARAGRIAYFHCQAGLGRTGTVMGVLLRELGFPGQAALDELVRLRMEAHLHEGSPEFETQREFVRRWRV
jgi:protein-tyrosine phosphatase